MMTCIVGIDPGLSGGLARLVDSVVTTMPTPVVKTARRRSGSKTALPDYDLALMLGTLQLINPDLVVLEQSRIQKPGMTSRASVWMIGRGAGLWEMACAALKLRMMIVAPQIWKRQAGLLGQPKNAGLLRLKQWFPNQDWTGTKDGEWDAALIAATAAGYRVGNAEPLDRGVA